MTPATYRVALLSIPGVGRRTAARVLQGFPTADALLEASTPDMAALAGIDERVRAALQKQVQEQLQPAADTIRAMEGRGVTVLTPDSRWFPHRLASMPDPPVVLFLRGAPDALVAPGVAVVGTRTPTSLGVEITRRVTDWLVKQGYGIISGLALGVDAAAHETAVQAGGRTVAFLPSALDRIYPPEHEELAERIARNGGALVSEYLPGRPPRREAFVARDRLQAGMASVVVAVQTEVTGGTMHTVRFAEQLARPVYCPTPVAVEQGASVWQGIATLLAGGRATPFDPTSLQTLREALG